MRPLVHIAVGPVLPYCSCCSTRFLLLFVLVRQMRIFFFYESSERVETHKSATLLCFLDAAISRAAWEAHATGEVSGEKGLKKERVVKRKDSAHTEKVQLAPLGIYSSSLATRISRK